MVHRRSDLILHPVRLRIVLAASGREVTTADLGEELPDVPQASLYRHVAMLTEAGVLEVVSERPVRGAVERTYRVPAGAASVTAEDVESMTPDEHVAAFTTFVGALMDAFGRYIGSPGSDPAVDGVGYRQVPLWLDDDELVSLAEELGSVLEGYAALEPTDHRRRRTFTTIVIPDPTPRRASS